MEKSEIIIIIIIGIVSITFAVLVINSSRVRYSKNYKVCESKSFADCFYADTLEEVEGCAVLDGGEIKICGEYIIQDRQKIYDNNPSETPKGDI